MKEPFKSMLSPLNFAGYVAWAAIGWELLFSRWLPPGGLALQAPTSLLAALHLAFLVFFVAVTSGPWSDATKRAMVFAQIILTFSLMLVARNSSLAILLILCAVQIVQLWSPRSALLILLAANGLAYLTFHQVWQLNSPLATTLMNLSFQAFAALTSWFAFSAEKARDELAAVNADLLATRSLLSETARDSERLRLSRELHDVAGHKLTALKLNLAALARDPRFSADEQVRLCARLADELLADIRGVVMQMRRDDGLDLEAAMQALATPFARPRMQLQIEPQARVGSLAQAEAVLRAVQEGLTNAVRHSQANTLWIVLRRDQAVLRLDIRDDGRGSGELQAGNGLRGMRERLEGVGGGLDVRRTDTGGVHLQAWLPVAA